MRRCLRLVGVAIFFAAAFQRCHAADLLILSFDSQDKPFADGSPAGLLVTPGTMTEGTITGKGVKWSDSAPKSPAGGGYAVFDGGSFLTVQGAASLALPSDFTIRFWFKSPGIDRGESFGFKYRFRMHPLRLGTGPDNNLDIDFNDTDGGNHGLWTYWLGGGNPFIWTPAGTLNKFTNNRWYNYWLVREKGILTLYVGDEKRNYSIIGTSKGEGTLGSPVAPIQIGRVFPFSSGPVTCLCWLGALDEIRIANEALHPTGRCQ